MVDQNLPSGLRDLDRTISALLKRPQWKSGRKFPPYSAKAIAEYARLIGEITWASNSLHATFARIFAQLVEPGSFTVGLEIWNSVKTDSAQRDMVKAAARGRAALRLLGDRNLAARIAWLCDGASRISAYRNDAVHTPMSALLTGKGKGKWKPMPSPIVPSTRFERLSANRYVRLFTLLRGDLIELNHYATGIDKQLAALFFGHAPEPLPKRPQLQSHAFLIRELAPKPHKADRQKGRKRLPPASG